MISIEQPQQPLGLLWWILFAVAIFFSLLAVILFVLDLAGLTLSGPIKDCVCAVGQFLKAV